MRKHNWDPKLAVGVREHLKLAEDHAVTIRKLLRQMELSADSESNKSQSWDDAVKLALLVEKLAHKGQAAAAADAIVIAEKVQLMLDLLLNELDMLLAS